MTIDEYIEQRLEKLKGEIVGNMEAKKINASGRTASSFRVEKYDNGFRLIGGGEGAAPLFTLEVGRVAGKVPMGFTSILVQWSRDKGITFATERERNTFAYFLGKKIAKEGTKRNKQKEDVYSSAVKSAVEDISKQLLVSVKEHIQLNFK
jgi:hypothetical protein